MANKTTSPRRLAANRANAQLSTGPTSSEGKAKSSLNAVKTGLTGRAVLLPSEDAAVYQEHVRGFHKELQPVGPLETIVVQSLADIRWRLNRIPSLESGILALGRKRCDPDLFAEEKDPQVREVLLQAHVFNTEAQALKNLYLQESRLRRQYANDIKELERLRAERAARQKEEDEEPCDCDECRAARQADEVEENEEETRNGFEFSNQQSPRSPSDQTRSTQ